MVAKFRQTSNIKARTIFLKIIYKLIFMKKDSFRDGLHNQSMYTIW